MPYSVVAYDLVPLSLEGLKSFFDRLDEYQLIAYFNDFNDFIDYIEQNSTNIVIINDNIPKKSFPDSIRFVHEKLPDAKIIVISDDTSEYKIFATVKNGASSYLYKPNTTFDELNKALDTIINDEDYFNEPISHIIIQSYVKNAKKGNEISQRNPKNLTRREVQILQLICEGLTSKQIADGLFISVRTVEAHKNHIMQKLGLKSTAQLVKFAIKNGYVKL